VDDVAANIDGQVTADGAGSRLLRLGLADQSASGLDDLAALQSQQNNRARGEEADQVGKERTSLKYEK
jgi:hypothetical protein